MIDNAAVIEVSCGVKGVAPVLVTCTPAFVLRMIPAEDKTDEELKGGQSCCTALGLQGAI